MVIPYFSCNFFFLSLPRTFFHCFIEREEGRERKTERHINVWERNINWLPPICTLTGGWAHNLGLCPDWGSNPQPFSLWDYAPTNWATQARGVSWIFDVVMGKYHIYLHHHHDWKSSQDPISEFTDEYRMLNKQSWHHGDYHNEWLWNYTEGHPVFGGQGMLPGGSVICADKLPSKSQSA